MAKLADVQHQFMTAVRDSERAVPDFLDAERAETQRALRFSIYRNNHYAGVIKILRARFPVIERLVGDEFFRAMARVFVQETPPATQLNLDYGGAFPDFIQRFPPVEDLPYLPDLARLEWARFEAAYAPDAEPMTANGIAVIPPEFASIARIDLHPALRWVTSRFPILDIWRTNHEDKEVRRVDAGAAGQDVLISRPRAKVETHVLPVCGTRLIESLARGASLGGAVEAAGDVLTEPQLASVLTLLVSAGAITNVHLPSITHSELRC